MASFEQFLSTFSNNPNKKGEQFEYFVKEFLKNDLYWKSKVKTVWPFKDFPINWGQDIGTDLIFEDFEGKYWAVQVKNYDSEYSVTKEDVNSFLSDSNRSIIHKRLLIISTNKIAKNGLKTINDQEKEVVVFRLQDFKGRGDIYPDRLNDIVKFKKPRIPTPKPHQRKAKNEVVKKFKECSKGQLIMACGTGKTYTFFWIHKDLKSKKTLVLVPSLNLLSQTLEAWIMANGSTFTSLCICSDPSVAKNVQEDEIVLDQSDIPYSVTWDVNEIVSFLKRPEPTVIFSTYQSSDLIAKAQKKVPNHMFDLSIADEAHRCTGKANSEFTTILDDKKIRSHKKLFGTATPKLYKPYIKKAAQDKEIEIIDMNDEEKFGVVLHNLSFGKAIKKKLLADYQVIVVGVNDSRVKEMIDQREFVSVRENHKSDAASLATQVGFIKAIKDYNLSRLVTFHGRVKKASEFSKSLPQIYEWTKSEYKGNKELDIDYVSGKMPTSERRGKLNELKNIESNQIGILSNARCLGEGVDVPNMDGIAFINPKSSEIDIVQSIGRAIRKPDSNKTIGYIILPIFIENKDSFEESIESDAFEPVWKVMNALKSHDEDFKIELDNLRMNLGKTTITGQPPKFVFDLPKKIGSTFQDKITTHIIEKVTESWYFNFGLLEKYYQTFGISRVNQKLVFKNVYLGRWVLVQRGLYNKGQLSKERIDKLEQTFPDWSWDVDEDKWLDNFNLLKEFYVKFKTTRLPVKSKGKVKKIYLWVLVQRQEYKQKKLSQDKINKLEQTFIDWTWDPLVEDWQKNFNVLEEYYTQFKTSRVRHNKVFKKLNIGNWVQVQRGLYNKGQLSKERIDKLEQTFLDWSWDPNEDRWLDNFNLLKEYYTKFKTSRIPIDKKYKNVNLGRWIMVQRRYYNQKNKSRSTKLTQERIIKIEQTFHDWIWNPQDHIWLEKFDVLKDYYTQFKTSRVRQNEVFKKLNIGNWVQSQRMLYKKGKLLQERIDKLEQTFPDWVWDPEGDRWLKKFNALEEYYKKFGTSSILKTQTFKGLNLHAWVIDRRKDYKEGRLSKEIINKFERTFHDWSWNPAEDYWSNCFYSLKDYYTKFKTSRVTGNFVFKELKIGIWVLSQRALYKKGKLSQERINKLEQTFHDWSWNPLEEDWLKYFEAFKEYYYEFKTLRIPKRKKYKDLDVGRWVQRQRTQYKRNKLTKEKIDKFEQTFPDWSWVSKKNS